MARKTSYRYPLDRTQERIFPPDFSGRIYVWDIDKTYLASDIDSLRGLLAIPLEFAVDKRNVAGTPALLRALRRGVAPVGLTDANPIYFVSASPPQLRSVIERKMLPKPKLSDAKLAELGAGAGDVVEGSVAGSGGSEKPKKEGGSWLDRMKEAIEENATGKKKKQTFEASADEKKQIDRDRRKRLKKKGK